MDPQQVFCPQSDCPARGQVGKGNIGIHSQKEKRFICRACRKTFSARKGTAFFLLRTPEETVTLVHLTTLRGSATRLLRWGEYTAILIFGKLGDDGQSPPTRRGR
ncbi:MAG: hypothetical protein HY259_09060 [Chloroflexi bacterium]|nr:hypothetical protein [Chloroflexota bacterium]